MLARALVGCALLTALAGTPSCVDPALPHIKRVAQIPAELVPCVLDALASDVAWTREDRSGRSHPPPPTDVALLLQTEVGLVAVQALVRVEQAGASLSFHSYIKSSAQDWEGKLAARRARIETVYRHLREACPELPAWEETTERSVRAEPAPAFGIRLPELLRISIGIGLLITFLLGLRRLRAARRRGEPSDG